MHILTAALVVVVVAAGGCEAQSSSRRPKPTPLPFDFTTGSDDRKGISSSGSDGLFGSGQSNPFGSSGHVLVPQGIPGTPLPTTFDSHGQPVVLTPGNFVGQGFGGTSHPFGQGGLSPNTIRGQGSFGSFPGQGGLSSNTISGQGGFSSFPGQGFSSIPGQGTFSSFPGQGGFSSFHGQSSFPGQGTLSSFPGQGFSSFSGQGGLSSFPGQSSFSGQGTLSSFPGQGGLTSIPQGNVIFIPGRGSFLIPNTLSGQGAFGTPVGVGQPLSRQDTVFNTGLVSPNPGGSRFTGNVPVLFAPVSSGLSPGNRLPVEGFIHAPVGQQPSGFFPQSNLGQLSTSNILRPNQVTAVPSVFPPPPFLSDGRFHSPNDFRLRPSFGSSSSSSTIGSTLPSRLPVPGSGRRAFAVSKTGTPAATSASTTSTKSEKSKN